MIIRSSGSGKTKYLLNSIQKDNNIIDKTYFYAKYLEEPKYQLLINKREKAGTNFNNDPTAFIEYSNSMDDIFPQIEDYYRKRKRKILIVFDDMISHAMSDKKAQRVLKDLFIRCRKLNISLCFLTQSYFSVPKDVRLNCTHYILFKLHNIMIILIILLMLTIKILLRFIGIVRGNYIISRLIDTTKDKKFIKNFDETL